MSWPLFVPYQIFLMGGRMLRALLRMYGYLRMAKEKFARSDQPLLSLDFMMVIVLDYTVPRVAMVHFILL